MTDDAADLLAALDAPVCVEYRRATLTPDPLVEAWRRAALADPMTSGDAATAAVRPDPEPT